MLCPCAGGMPQNQKICPHGCTLPYASSQQLYARQILLLQSDDALSEAGGSPFTDQQHQQSTAKGNNLMHRLSSLLKRALCHGRTSVEVDEDEYHNEDDYTIHGPAVDVYSAGVVLYEMVSLSLLQPSVMYLTVICCCIT